MTVLVVRGDALHLPLRDNSVDLIVTSPPYFALRAYQTGHEMEVGSEATPQAYLEALWAATREMKRVLKPSGSIWINLGDKYATAFGPNSTAGKTNWSSPNSRYDGSQRSQNRAVRTVREKSLIGLPWRYAIGCIDQLGLILRRDLIWDKPNGLPESVTDRPRSSHEYWFMFVKQPRYFAALDELREPHTGYHGNDFKQARSSNSGTNHRALARDESLFNPLGKLPGSVWSIPSEPLRLPPWTRTQHYAAFPTEWPRRLILGFTPHLVCGKCGVGRFPVIDRKPMVWRQSPTIAGRTQPGSSLRPASGTQLEPAEATILGYACACTPFTDHPGTGGPRQHDYEPGEIGGYPNTLMGLGHAGLGGRPRLSGWREYHLDQWTPPPGHPATVCDPFGGTGTVAHVAHALGRHAISIDLSEPYCRLAADTSLGSLARQRAAKVQGRVHAERQGSLL